MPTIAILGASSDRAKFGNKCVRAYALRGYHVYPINPKDATIEGWSAFKSILDLPVDAVDRVSIYLPPEVSVKVLDEVAKKQATEVWLNPGSDAPEVLEKARQLGLNAIQGCSIVAIGVSPEELN
jgi:predicted CoA-binding protein